MNRFKDITLSDTIPGYPCTVVPKWSTDIQTVDSGAERVNQRWSDPLRTFIFPDAIREHDTFEEIYSLWLTMRGPYYTFAFSDPLDFASVPLELPNVAPTIGFLDQSLGTGDGFTKTFQLTKTYTSGSESYTRDIYHPVTSSVLIGFDGANVDTLSPTPIWSVDRNTGVVTFETAPASGVVITAGFYFDVEVRFSSDTDFEGVVRTTNVSGFSDLTLVEVRPCAC